MATRSKQPTQPQPQPATIDRQILNYKIRIRMLTMQARAFTDWYQAQRQQLYEIMPFNEYLKWWAGLTHEERVPYMRILDKMPKDDLIVEYQAIDDHLAILSVNDQDDQQNIFEGRCRLVDSLAAARFADFDTALRLADTALQRLRLIVTRSRRSSRSHRQLDSALAEALTAVAVEVEQLIAGLRHARTVAA